MKQYQELLEYVMKYGKRKSDPQGVGNVAVFAHMMRFRPAEEFPLLTTKKINLRYVIGELLWFLRGDTRIDFLKENKIPIWNQWAAKEVTEQYGLEEGDVGRIYPAQWIHWKKRNGGEINQIAELVKDLKSNPDSRRHMVTSWNPEDLNVPVAPCHGIFKCFVADGELSLAMIQRSADVFIGVPFNTASYSSLLLMLAQVTGLKPGEFVHILLDTHIYLHHFKQVKLQLSRTPKNLPRVILNSEVKDIFKFSFDDFYLDGYDPYPFIPAPVGL